MENGDDTKPTLKERLAERLGHVFCWVTGGFHHCLLLNREPHCLKLVCSICGYSTNGIEIGRQSSESNPDRSLANWTKVP